MPWSLRVMNARCTAPAKQKPGRFVRSFVRSCVTSCLGEAQKEETLGHLPPVDEKGPSSVRRILQFVSRIELPDNREAVRFMSPFTSRSQSSTLVVLRIVVSSSERGVTPAIYQHVPHSLHQVPTRSGQRGQLQTSSTALTQTQKHRLLAVCTID